MKNKKTIALTVASFAISALAMVGSTVAWFQAMNTANVAFSGTVVSADAKLDIGFRVDGVIEDAEDLGLVLDGGVYWAPNTVSPAIMNAVFAAGAYAEDNVLTPITSGSYEAGDDLLPFYSTPVFDANRGLDERIVAIDEEADKTHYVGFTVVFRRIDADRETGLEGSAIYFDKNTSIKGEGVSADALRLGFEYNYKNEDNEDVLVSDIIKPTVALTDLVDDDENPTNTINVGGVMDLNGDSANDYTLLEYDTAILEMAQYEIAYGEFDDDTVWDNSAWAANPAEAGDEGVVVPSPFSNPDFSAGQTAVGVHALLATPKTAEYNSFEAYSVLSDEEDASPIALTDADGLAEVDFVLWLEGWDPACTNAIAEASYGATLTFISQDPAPVTPDPDPEPVRP